MQKTIACNLIKDNIFIIRGYKVILSNHLAKLYNVEPKVLIQAVKRNAARFPRDFMFQLTNKEVTILKSQIVTSRWGGIRRANPYAFTEQGIAMLSSVLNSKRAIQVNIAIMRAFVKLREMVSAHKELEQKISKHDKEIQVIFEAIRQLMIVPKKPKSKIGFH